MRIRYKYVIYQKKKSRLKPPSNREIERKCINIKNQDQKSS